MSRPKAHHRALAPIADALLSMLDSAQEWAQPWTPLPALKKAGYRPEADASRSAAYDALKADVMAAELSLDYPETENRAARLLAHASSDQTQKPDFRSARRIIRASAAEEVISWVQTHRERGLLMRSDKLKTSLFVLPFDGYRNEGSEGGGRSHGVVSYGLVVVSHLGDRGQAALDYLKRTFCADSILAAFCPDETTTGRICSSRLFQPTHGGEFSYRGEVTVIGRNSRNLRLVVSAKSEFSPESEIPSPSFYLHALFDNEARV